MRDCMSECLMWPTSLVAVAAYRDREDTQPKQLQPIQEVLD